MSPTFTPSPPAAPSALAIPIPTAATQEWLVSRIAEIIGVDLSVVDPDADVADFDLDSTEVLMLCAELEAHLGIRVDAALLWTSRSLAGLATYAATLQHVHRVAA